jgi:hypothetical protein
MRRRLRPGSGRVAVLALVAGLAGCEISGPGDPTFEVYRNRAVWRAERPESYEYTVQRLCFCITDAVRPVRVRVSGESVTSRVYAADATPVPSQYAESFPSVEGLFQLILDAMDDEADEIDVVYDPDTGVPLEIAIDYIAMAVDDELTVRVVEDVTPTS